MAEYGLLGEKLPYSFSPEIHAEFGDYDYRLIELAPQELDGFLRAGEFRGLNVTIPYKKAVIPYCSELSDAAKAIGAVNTITVGADGKLRGDNTDYYGFCYMARIAGVRFTGKKVLVLGSGGTSLTACAAIRDAGGTPVVISRSGETNYQNLERHQDAKIVVNTTPVGTFPHTDASPLDLARLPEIEAVLDVVYNPGMTRLLLQARRLGLCYSSGLRMLVAQAKRASELFQGKAIPDREIERVANKLSLKSTSIVLIGMPGSGKTTVGKLVAEMLGRQFIDLDEEIERSAGICIPEIFARQGEEAFRRLESELAQLFGSRTGIVLATGGGVVKDAQNYNRLAQNGRIFWLTRDLERLDRDGRPLSGDDETMYRMYRERLPLYRAFADAAVENNDAPDATAREIVREFLS